MANSIVRLPLGYFPDPDRGRPLFNAKIWVGEPDTLPANIPSNQKLVTGRQEDGTEVPLAQPIRTSAGGIPVDADGNYVTLLVDGAYSMRVDDRNDNQVYYFADVLAGAPVTFDDKPVLYRDTVALAIADIGLSVGQYVTTKGYATVNGGGGANYIVVAGGTGTDDGGSYHDMANGNQLELKQEGEKVNAKVFGLVGDGSTDNKTQNDRFMAYLEALGGVAYYPSGVYVFSAARLPQGICILGDGRLNTTLKLADNANTYLIADASYVDNDPLATLGGYIKDIRLDGNKGNNTSGSCLIIKSYRHYMENVDFNNAADYGCLYTELSENGTANTNGLAENKWLECSFNRNDKGGLRAENGPNNQIADGYVQGCAFFENGGNGDADIYVERAAGWKILENQLYAGGFHCIYVDKMSRAVISGNHCDMRASAAIGGDNPSCIFIQNNLSASAVTDNIILNNHDGGVSGATPVGIYINLTSVSLVVVDNIGLNQGTNESFYIFNPVAIQNCTIDNQIGDWDIGQNPYGIVQNLNNAEEGVFTPTANFATNGDFVPTYTVQNGTYIRNGDLVWFQIGLNFDTNAYTTASGSFFIDGLPYSSRSSTFFFDNPVTLGPSENITYSSGRVLTSHIAPNTTRVQFRTVLGGTTHADISTGNVTASTNGIQLTVSGTYITRNV